jgi:hypothetical protein
VPKLSTNTSKMETFLDETTTVAVKKVWPPKIDSYEGKKERLRKCINKIKGKVVTFSDNVQIKIISETRDDNFSFSDYLNHKTSTRTVEMNESMQLTSRQEVIYGYEYEITKGPDLECVSCEGLFFDRSVQNLNLDAIANELHLFLTKKYEDNKLIWICHSCMSDFTNGHIPSLYIRKIAMPADVYGLEFPPLDDKITILTDTEQRLCSPIVQFTKITPLEYQKLSGPRFGDIYLPISKAATCQMLPRSLDQTEIVQVNIDKSLDSIFIRFKDIVSSKNIFEAVEYLRNQPLFSILKIYVSSNWMESNKESLIDEKRNNTNLPKKYQFELDDSFNADDIAQIVDLPSMSSNKYVSNDRILVNDTLIICNQDDYRVHQFFDEAFQLAIKDFDFDEETAFIKIYCGKICSIEQDINVFSRCRSYLMRSDRRCAQSSSFIFYLYRKVVSFNLENSNYFNQIELDVDTSVMSYGSLNEEYIYTGEGKHFFAAIQSMPCFWRHKQDELHAMIRQLGYPSFYLTLNAIETDWPELIVCLVKILEKRQISLGEAKSFDRGYCVELIKQDPVTVSRYISDRFQHLLTYMCNTQAGPFIENRVKDYAWRIEFKAIGVPCIHMMLWLKDAPAYGRHSCAAFVDKYTTCSVPLEADIEVDENEKDEPESDGCIRKFVQRQRHIHERDCNIRNCSKGYPFPILDKSVVLEPLPQETETEREEFKRCYGNFLTIMKMLEELAISPFKRKPFGLRQFLIVLQMAELDYFRALRSSISKTTIFHERKSNEIMIVPYNKAILARHRGSMSMHFLLDSADIINCVKAFTKKSKSVMSEIFRLNAEQSSEVKRTNQAKLDIFNCREDNMQNHTEMSVHECVFYMLNMPVMVSSRRSVFVFTYPLQTREQLLSTLSTEQYDIGLIEQYILRPHTLTDICLAEFAAFYDYSPRDTWGEIHVSDFSSESDLTGNLTSEDKTDSMRLLHFSGFIKRRNRAKIVNYLGYKKDLNQEEYYRELLMLYLPWPSNVSDTEGMSFSERYEIKKEIVNVNRATFDQFIDDEQDGDRICKGLSHEKPIEPAILDEKEEVARSVLEDNLNEETIGTNRYTALMTSLNRRQHLYLMNLLNRLKKNKLFYHFVTGCAGTGKSRLIKAIEQTINRSFNDRNQIGVESDNGKDSIKVLLTALTGQAAFCIRGSTLHRAFQIQTNNNDPLKPQTLSKFQDDYKGLRLLIIDEISMVGSCMFVKVEKRLREIFNPDLQFGGIPIVAFGDFNQLQPVQDDFLFTRGKAAYDLWTHFKCFELTEIMRQKDDLKFTEALNVIGNIGLIGLTKDQIDMLDTRFVKNEDEIPEGAIVLFMENVDKHEYNEKKINQMPGELFIQNVEYTKDGVDEDERLMQTANAYVNTLKTDETLPSAISLKLNCKYTIIANIDVNDGLANGTFGLLKQIIKTDDGQYAKILMFDFQDNEIGVKAKEKYAKKTNNPAFAQGPETPLERFEMKHNLTHMKGVSVTRRQFLITECEAMTIHKSQGQTFGSVALNTTKKKLKRDSLYVALSRVAKLSDLYLYGAKSIVDGQDFLQISVSERSRRIEILKKSNVQTELRRLRTEARLTNDFIFLSEVQNSQLSLNNNNAHKIMYHNVADLGVNLEFIKADYAVKAADILFFTQCRSRPSDLQNLTIPGFVLKHLSGYNKANSSNGIACYIKENIAGLLTVNHNADKQLFCKGRHSLEACITSFKIGEKPLYIACIYRHKEQKFDEFKNQLREFIRANVPNVEKEGSTSNLIIIGDFQIDMEKQIEQKNKIFDKFYLKFMNEDKIEYSHVDWAITNIDCKELPHRLIPYESYFSDRKPLWLYLKK